MDGRLQIITYVGPELGISVIDLLHGPTTDTEVKQLDFSALD